MIRTFIFLALLFAANHLPAQVYYKAKIIGEAQGLSDNRVTCFYKDKKGFMWIGTRNGLNRYDGHGFTIFRPGPGNSISNEVINDIAEDSSGNIWVATMEGLNYYDPRTGRWDCLVPSTGTAPKALPNYIVWDISFDREDRVWIACDVFEFSSYDRRTKRFTYYDWPAFARSEPRLKGGYHSIRKFIPGGDKIFWLASNKGLVRLDITSKAFHFIGGGYNGEVPDLRKDSLSGRIYLSVQRGGLFAYDAATGSYDEIQVKPEAYPSTELSPPQAGELWLAAEKGLIKLGKDRAEAWLSQHQPLLSASPLPGGVHAVFEDDTGLRWLASSNGVALYDRRGSAPYFLPLLAVSDKESSNRMGGVFFDRASNTYFACVNDPAMVFVIDAATGIIRPITRDAAGQPLSACHTIKQDRLGQLWLLTDNQVYRFQRNTKQFHVFPLPNNGEKALFRDLVQDREGNYWIGSFYKDLYYYRARENRIISSADSLFRPVSTVTSLFEDTLHGAIWIGTFSQALFRYDLKTGKLAAYYESAGNRGYAGLNLVHDIFSDQQHTTWVATQSSGLFRFNEGSPYEKAFTRFDMKTGLSGNNFLAGAAGPGSLLWLLSWKGITVMDNRGNFRQDISGKENFDFSSYGSDLNLPHDIFYDTGRQELLVGVAGGLLFYPALADQRPQSFPVLLTRIRVNGKEAGFAGSNLRVPFRNNSLSLEFAGLYFGTSPVAYEYLLEGADTGWTRAADNKSVFYQNLPAGHYRFRVRAVDAGGNLLGESEQLLFRVATPFWQSGWFMAAIGLLLGLALFRFIQRLRRRIEEEKRLNAFATSLYGQHTVEDIFWDTARNCIETLGFIDCVVYQLDEQRAVLLQKAAFGPKNPWRREILNPIDIPVGQGIVGTVARTGKPELVRNTDRDPRYITDDERRLSEISVPVFVDGKLFAVIDSEHPRRRFFKPYHLRMLKKIAAVCSERITKYLGEEKLRGKIARDLHDEMGSTLTSINITSKVAMQETGETEKVKRYLQMIKDHSGRMMESMSDIVWAINPANDSLEKVLLRMKEFAAEILEPARINYYFREEGPIETARLNLEQRRDIYMIFKEALSNAVKYSGATEVNILLQQQEGSLRMLIMDNGNGFDTAAAYSGNGLINMKKRAEDMQARLGIESIPGTGTRISVDIPLT